MERDVVSGEAGRQSDVYRIRTGTAARLSCPRRAVRKLVRAGLGHSCGSPIFHWARCALSALAESGLNNNLYVQIGLVLLMALSAKNAILIVEFARELRAAGKPILDSAEAARARFRPIVMTSFAFILGVVPLVL